jgi:purine-binding chemotaxis protein CheW
MNGHEVEVELRRRAAHLSTSSIPVAPVDVVEVVEFRWDGYRYAVPITDVRETVQDVTVTVVPGARPPLIGAATVRSQAIPVIDVRHLLDLAAPRRPALRLVVLEAGGRASLALAADELERLSTIAVSELHHPDDRPTVVAAETSSGTTLLDATALLDLPAFFSASEGPPT